MLVSIGFSSTIFENSIASGAPPPEPHTNANDNIFLNYWHNFGEKLDKIIFKKFEKIAKIPFELSKNRRFPLIFLLRFPNIR